MPVRVLLSRALSVVRAHPKVLLGIVAFAAVAGVAAVQGPGTEEAFYSRWGADPENLPYRPDVNARVAVDQGKARAASSRKILMVTFGANWCPDCLTLQKNLRASSTRRYAEEHFEMVHIDVGDAAHTAQVQRDLGITVRSIPLAVFYSPDGELVGDTFGGELEASRHYSSREILDFLREVVDYHRVVSPDQRQ